MRETRFQMGKALPVHHYRPDPCYTAGLDLGQRSDFSALAIIEEPIWVPVGLPTWLRGEPEPLAGCYVRPTDLMETWQSFAERRKALADALRKSGDKLPRIDRGLPTLSLRYLHRWPLGTSYPTIVADVGALLRRDPLKGCTTLVIDYTGVGRPVGEMFTQAGLVHTPLVITGGNKTIQDAGELHVPKRDLAMAAQALLQSGRLRFAGKLPLLDVLKAELQAFEVKTKAITGHDQYLAWREGAHDDIVLAAAMAGWYREWASGRSGAFSMSYLGQRSDMPGYPLD